MDNRAFAELCQRQYGAALRMLRTAVEKCPDELWDDREGGEAPFWQQALHTAFYAALYLKPSLQAEGGEDPMTIMRQLGAPMKDFSEPEIGRMAETMGRMTDRNFKVPRTMTREELLGHVANAERACVAMAQQVAADGADGKNPMPWMKGTRADLLLYNLRHIQHHVGRLHSVLGRRGEVRLKWIGGMP